MASKKKTEEQIRQEKTSLVMNTVAKRAAYYRENPHRFAEEVLGLNLKLFQKILLVMMFRNYYFMYIASRGQGKSWLSAVFCVIRCILYPHTRIVCSSGTKGQANIVLLKIQDDLMKNSSLLRSEIEKCNIGQNEAAIYFKNGSWIKTAVSSDNARGMRANILIIDEFRLVDKKIMDTVLKKFLSASRNPGYLKKDKYKHLQERNKQLYLSSAYFKDSDMYEKAKDYTVGLLDDTKRYFISGLPYQLALKEGLLMRDAIEDEMSESTFSDITWMMEMESLFYGAGEDSLFSYSAITNQRKLYDSFYPLEVYRNKDIKIPEVEKGNERILSVDIALLASKKHDNDASALEINDCKRAGETNYISNIVYIETQEGLTTDDLGLLVMRFYYQYKCTYIALDANGIGQAILDYLMSNRYDPMYNITYPALNCCNNDDLAERCKIKNAPKVIYAIKANASSNNDMCLALRSAIQNGTINFLVKDDQADVYIKKNIKGFNRMTINEQVQYRLPYMQTSLLIEELAKLEHEDKNGKVVVKERSGMRKDRYSSLLYNYLVVQELTRKLKPKRNIEEEIISQLPIRQSRRLSYFS